MNKIEKKLLTPTEVSDLTRIPLRSLITLRRRGDGPPFIRISRKIVLYSAEELEQWLAKASSSQEESK